MKIHEIQFKLNSCLNELNKFLINFIVFFDFEASNLFNNLYVELIQLALRERSTFMALYCVEGGTTRHDASDAHANHGPVNFPPVGN